MLKRLLLPVLLLIFLAGLRNGAAAQTAEGQAIVQAILFYSPTCPHCHNVINELLLPMQEEYGDQLQIIGIDVTHPAGSELYGRAIERFNVPQSRRGSVPTLVVGDTVLVGGLEIPEQFPGIVEAGLAAGGIGWPDIPDLALIVPDLPPSAEADSGESVADRAEASEQNPVPTADSAGSGEAAVGAVDPGKSLEDAENVISTAGSATDTPPDPDGFSLAWVLLIGMAVALIYAARQIAAGWSGSGLVAAEGATWLVPALALLGLGVALYLAYVEVTHVEAVCGPVGECNIVQSSPYAALFGIPVAVLGVLSYVAIILLWLGQRYLPARFSSWCSLGLVLLTIFGTLFSIYLTLLEIFVIKAVCLWCLSSAVLTTLIMILVVKEIEGRSPRAELAAQTKG